MIRSFLAWFDRLIFVPPLLARDVDGCYVSPAGRAYRVTVQPQPGAENVVLVTLDGNPCVPNTYINHLAVRVAPKASAIDSAIRELLRRCDEAEARFAVVRAAYDWPAITTSTPEEEAARAEAAVREALASVSDAEASDEVEESV